MNLTPTQKKIWETLQDGKPHSVTELGRFLWDDMGDPRTSMKMQMSRLRNILISEGFDVLWKSIQGQPCYVLVKYIAPQPDCYLVTPASQN